MALDGIELHDATLLGIGFEWEAGLAVIRIRTHAEGDYSIVVEGCHGFRLSREMPWGRSISIHKCDVVRKSLGFTILLEMQSGDELEIHGKCIRVEEVG